MQRATLSSGPNIDTRVAAHYTQYTKYSVVHVNKPTTPITLKAFSNPFHSTRKSNTYNIMGLSVKSLGF